VVFPETSRHQALKLVANGQALGGDMLFRRRIGFSGTPSDLLPVELGTCQYEAGADGQMLAFLTSPSVCSWERLPSDWSPQSILMQIAKKDNPPYHALIDTGALITGMDNLAVARFLLENGLPKMKGVIFLDPFDRKRVLVRATMRVMTIEQCGISKAERFSFFDQIHTTGMDIPQVLNAKAVCTLGKDMTFRDYAQGTYRMRGIGSGQTIHVYVIPEVEQLVLKHSALGEGKGKEFQKVQNDVTTESMLRKICAWLVINSMRSEKVQFNMLSEQSTRNVWSKRAFYNLLEHHERVGEVSCF
jgi:hypothetical protein